VHPTEQAYRRDTATWIAFAALFAFGLLNAMLGPVLPYLRQAEHISYVAGALHQAAFAVGGMAAGILASRSAAPRRRTISVGLAGAAVAGLVLGYAEALPATLVAALLISAFGTAALIRTWALLADLHAGHRAVAMTEGEVVVSLAGVLTPLVVSSCAAAAVSWRFAFVIAGVAVVTSAVAVGLTPLPDPRPTPAPQRRPSSSPEPDRPAPRLPRSLGTILAVVGLEFTLSFWAASYLHDDVGISRDTSVALVSSLYAANLVGRLVASRLARRLPADVVLRIFLATALAGLPWLLLADSAPVAGVGLAITGIGIGGTFPLAASRYVTESRRSADQALGQILTVAGVGQIVGPLAAGVLAQGIGLRLGLLVLPAFVLLATVTTGKSRRLGNVDP
jgi:fucose permease